EPCFVSLCKKTPVASDLPMLRHIRQPLHTRGLQTDVGIEAAGDSAVDNSLLLLLQQLDQLLLGVDVTPDPTIRMIEEADDGGMLRWRWDRKGRPQKRVIGQL